MKTELCNSQKKIVVKIRKGDLVKAYTADPQMVVTAIVGKKVDCMWYGSDELKRATFSLNELMKLRDGLK